MADTKAGAGDVCDDKCGCPTPCPGAASCRCTGKATATTGGMDFVHSKCSCGEHCGCNPCSCGSTEVATGRSGKANCKCGPGCDCTTCAS